MEYRAILFDLDGTLIDSLPGIEYAVDYALIQLRLPARNGSLRSLIGPPIRKIFAQIAQGSSEEELTELERAFRDSYDGGAWQRTLPHANAVQTLRTLHESGISLFVATNKPMQPTSAILKKLGMAPYFTALISRDSRQPPFLSKAEMLSSLLAQHQLRPETCLYVGDTLEDYEAGSAVGIAVALVPHGYGAFDSRGLPASSLPLANLADLLQFAERVEI